MPNSLFDSGPDHAPWDLKTLIGNYNKGFKGSIYDPAHYNKFMSELPMPLFGAAAGAIKDSGKGKLSLPFKSVLFFDKESYTERQTTGDCCQINTTISMADGSLKNIQDIEVGEYVLSHTNKKRKVLNTIKKQYSGKIVKFWVDGNTDPLEFTPDHLFIVLDKKRNKMSWKKIDDIWPGEYMLIPFGIDENECKEHIIDLADILPEGFTICENDPTKIKAWHAKDYCNRYIHIDDDMGWLIGIYLAEGGIGEGRTVRWALHINEIDFANEITRIVKEKFGIECKNWPDESDNSRDVACCNKTVGEFFYWLSPGNVYTKKVPDLIFKCNKDIRFKCLRGWVDGDGHFGLRQRKDPRYWELRANGGSVSKDLRDGMWRLTISLGIKSKKTTTPKAAHQTADPNICHFYGKRALMVFPEHEAEAASKIRLRDDNDVCQYGIRVKMKKKEVYQISNEFVYCLEVEEEHSFIAQSVACHNCVSMGTRNAVDITRAVQIHIGHTAEGWITRGATEAIYGSRHHGGQGMACSQAAEFVHKTGGIILRQKYASADLTVYNSSIGSRWGTAGVPRDIVEAGKQHQIKTVSLVRTIDEVRDALANGYGVACCSNQGFSSVRDKNGYSRPQGSWSHCMCICGCDDTHSIYNETTFCVVNSWGRNWISGPKPEFGIPDGAFMVRADTIARMVGGGGTFAYSEANGFPPVKLPDYGTKSFL